MADIGAMKFAIGQPVPRTEDPRLLTGSGRYTDDYNATGQAHGVFVRSTMAHGDIVSIDTAAALKSPGVLTVYTSADLVADGIGNLPCSMPLKSRNGDPVIVPPRLPLSVGKVRHVGDPIALVIAETAALAHDGAELVKVDIKELAATTVPERAVEADAPQLWEMVPGNVCLDFFLGDEEAVSAAFDNAAHVTRLRLNNTRMVVNAVEPRAAVAEYDPGQEKFTLHVPSQGVMGFRATMAKAVFGVPLEKVRVVSDDVGGSFGMKSMAHQEPAALLYAARKLERPVKWCADRAESFVADHQGRDSDITAELAMNEDGDFLALRITGYGNVGGYLTAMGPGPATGVISRNIMSVYKTPLLSYAVKCVMTNTVPTGPYRGAGRPESKYILERLIDHAARETGLDRIELRRRNLIAPDAFPYKAPNGQNYDSGEFESILDEALKKSDWDGFAKRRAKAQAQGLLRGISVSCYLENTAGGNEIADIRFEADGGITLITGTHDLGTGHATPFAQILSERLGVPFAAIRLVQNDSDLMSPGASGSGGSKSLIGTGGAIVDCSKAIIETGKGVAANVLEAAVEDIEFQITDGVGSFTVAGTDRAIGIMELAREKPGALDTLAHHDSSPSSFPNGCHVCEVEIDPETGEVALERYTVVDDFGLMVNPPIVEGQVQGGIAQGVGQILLERTVYDDDGQLITGTLMDYAVPRASHMVNIDFSTRNVPCRTNSLGVKGCGEAGNGGAMPAVMNAVIDALSVRGITHMEAPASPHRVWQALRDAQN